MSPQDLDHERLLAELTHLCEYTHELSNLVGVTMNCLLLAGASKSKRRFGDRVADATESAIKATGALQRLMWEIQALRRQLQLGQNPTNGGEDSEHR